jgi:membrane protein implicated in regulation of membrane protease activity
MSRLLATGLAVLAVALAGVALFAMSAGNLQLAGFSFLSVSIVLYFRETRVLGD